MSSVDSSEGDSREEEADQVEEEEKPGTSSLTGTATKPRDTDTSTSTGMPKASVAALVKPRSTEKDEPQEEEAERTCSPADSPDSADVRATRADEASSTPQPDDEAAAILTAATAAESASAEQRHQEQQLSPEEADNGHFKPHVLPADFEPSVNHVLCGRRKGHKDFGGNWPGNLALEQVIAKHLEAYQVSDDAGRQEIIAKILKHVRENGGGFCRGSVLLDDAKKPQQRWMDIGDVNACKDVSAIFQLFINARRSQIQRLQQRKHQMIHQQQVKHQQMAEKLLQQQRQLHQHQQQTQKQPKVIPPPPMETSPTQQRKSSSAGERKQSPVMTMALPTQLYALEKAKQKNNDVSDDPVQRRSFHGGETRTIAEVEKERRKRALRKQQFESEGPHKLAQHVAAATAVGRSAQPASAPVVTNTFSELAQLERPKKRRSVDESLAADALQMIAQAASTQEDDSTTNTSPTVRRKTSIHSPGPQESDVRQSPRTHVRVCCLQLGQRPPAETPWNSAQRALACLTSVALNEKDVDLFVLPELSPFGPTLDTFAKYLPLSHDRQAMFQRIDQAFCDQARALGVYIVYGTIAWHRHQADRSLKFTLKHKVVDRHGVVVAMYDKSYLSDLEFRFFEAGPRRPVTFSIDGFTFGLLVGDDLKYPNLARSLARDSDVDVIVHPSAESMPRYFRQCRAVENAVYVLGVEYSTGTTVAVPPDPDHEPVSMDAHPDGEEGEEGYLLTRIQQVAAEYARTNFPYYRNMKMEPKGVFA